MKKKFNFINKKKKFVFDVKVCDSFLKKATGLMFRKKSMPLLFVFNKKTREPIHSFFCISFICIWFYESKIIDVKLVYPWKISVRPKQKFDQFLEVPKNSKYYDVLVKEFKLE